MPQPGIYHSAALVEGHRLAGLVAKSRDRHRVQLPQGDGFVDTRKLHVLVEQIAQRRTVDQRHRHLGAQAQQAVANEAAGLANHSRPIAAHHLVTAEVAPERCQALDRRREITGATGQADRIDSAGGSADDHRERITRPGAQQFGDRRQHPHLVGRTGPTAGKNQTCDRLHRTHQSTPSMTPGGTSQCRGVNRVSGKAGARLADGS